MLKRLVHPAHQVPGVGVRPPGRLGAGVARPDQRLAGQVGLGDLLLAGAKAAPADAKVVKAFNTLFANVLADGRPVDVFLAGDDAQARADVSAFIESLGLRPFDAGPLPMAQALENAGLLEMGLMTHSLNHTDFFLGVSILS